MKKILIRALILICLICGIIVMIPVSQDIWAVRRHNSWQDTDKAYQWLVAAQRTNRQWLLFRTGLLPSMEKGEDCFVYDEALAAMAFTLNGEYDKAAMILRFFDKVRQKHIEEKGGIWGFTDVYKKDGRETETRAAGPAGWVLMAANYYYHETKDESFLPLARDIADWLLSLQSIEGGVIGGYYGNGNPMVWISSEHNFDCYSGFRDLGILTDDQKYLKAAKEVKKWLDDDVWDAKARRFFLGRRNPNFATDLSAWAVLSLGKEYAASLDFAVDKSLNTQTYKVKNVKVEGFDFGSTYQTSPFPDKDAVWFEGTGHMILAFAVAGREEERFYFLNELDKCLTDSRAYPYTKGLPYASNEGTPVYDSWLMQDEPLCISSTAWYVFAKKSYNPFSAFEDLDASNKVIKELDYDVDYQFVPVVDDFEYTDIKFQTAYPEDLILLNRAKVNLDWIDELAVDGTHSMAIEFIPDGNAKRAGATIRRPFLYPQDWSTYNAINMWVYSNGTSGNTGNIAYFNIKDREGEVYNSPPIFLNRSGWNKYSFNLWNDFKRDPYDGVNYGDNILGLSRVIECSFAVRTKQPVEMSKIYIDRIELVRSQ